MTDKNDKDGPSTSRFYVFTGAYLVVVFVGACGLGFFDPAGKPISPSDWGGVLAGVFSPLAFLWLIYTALSQRTELELQRKELAQNNITQGEQREEMKRQVEAMTAQAKLLEAQAAATFDPVLIVRHITTLKDFYSVTLDNRGSDVMNVIFQGDFDVRYYNGGSSGVDESEKEVYFWERDVGVVVYLKLDAHEALQQISVQYTRKDGASKRNVYLLSIRKMSLRLVQSDQVIPSIGHK